MRGDFILSAPTDDATRGETWTLTISADEDSYVIGL